jgi:hypothetical protein
MIFKIIKKRFTIAFAIALIAYCPIQANAWSMIGHRVVGEVADSYLTAKARAAVKAILGNESLAMSANWGDFAKSDSAYNYMYNWHFINLDPGMDKATVYKYAETEKAPNLYNKILALIADLKKPGLSATQKKLDLRMLVHMVGDLHQPMHTAHKDDLGGNKISVLWFGQKSNIHKVWDEQLVDYQQLSYTEYAKAINHPSAVQLYNWKNTSLKDVLFESYTICGKIYSTVKVDDKLSYRYNFDWVDTVNEQLLKGGIRLAQILNTIYS